MEHLRYIGMASEILAAVMATIYFSKYKNSNLKYLLLLLWFIPINEILSQFVFQKTATGYLLRNAYRIFVTMTLLFITYKELKNIRRKKILLVLIILGAGVFFINMIFKNPSSNFLSIGFTIVSIFTVIGLLCYLIELLKTDEMLRINRDLYLWVSVGFLIFFITYPVIFFTRTLLAEGKDDLIRALYIIQIIIAIASYITIAFGFYWGEKRKTQH